MPFSKEAAEKALQKLGLDIVSDEEIAYWNSIRNTGCEPNQEAVVTDWEDETYYLSRVFYIKDPSGESHGISRKALYGEWVGVSEPAIVLMDADGNDLS